MNNTPNIGYSSYSVNSNINFINPKIISHLKGSTNFSSTTDFSYKPKISTTISPINKNDKNHHNKILNNITNYNRQKCINTSYRKNKNFINSQKNTILSKKIIQKSFNSEFKQNIKNDTNIFNQSNHTKILESIHFDEDISLIETQKQNKNYFEKIAKEFEIGVLKQKIKNLKNKNNDIKKKIMNLKENNFNLVKNTILQHYQNKLIISDLINKYNKTELKIQKNKKQKLTFKNLILSLENLKIIYENKKLINSFYISLKEMIILSKIFSNEEIRNVSNDYTNLINKLISLSNENPNDYNDKYYYNIISKAMKILNINDRYKSPKIHFNRPTNNKNFYNKNQLSLSSVGYKSNNTTNRVDASKNIKEYTDYSIKVGSNDPKNLIFKKNLNFLNNSVNNYSCNLAELNSSFKRNTVKALWDMKMKNNLRLGENIQKHRSNYSSAYTFPSIKNRINMKKKKKYHFLNENNIISYTDSICINNVRGVIGEKYKKINKFIGSSKLKAKVKKLIKPKKDNIHYNIKK